MLRTLTPAFHPVHPPRAFARVAARLGRPRPLLVAAFVLSVIIHAAFSFWPEPLPQTPEDVPLTATITELPPPPAPAPVQPSAKLKPKARHTTRIPVPSLAPLPDAAVAESVPDLAPPPSVDASAAPTAVQDTPPAVAETRELPPPSAETVAAKTLPPRVDLAYRVFLGTQGFYIGDATYRFEHTGNHYRIHSVGEARGLAALVLRGQGKIESEGLITGSGLQPDQFALVRGEGRKREVAQFDWESGVVSLDDDKSAALELPTYDPLAFLWQFYFLPPTTDEQTFAIATTRKVYRYTFTREKTEWLELASGPVEAERWHRRSEDGKTDAFVWLAPKMHYVAVKLRFANTERGTVEALLNAIRVDETASAQ